LKEAKEKEKEKFFVLRYHNEYILQPPGMNMERVHTPESPQSVSDKLPQ
jgi:hypothetical protein